MAPHSSTLAWKIPWTEESGRLRSLGSLSPTRLSDFTFTFHFHALEKEMVTYSSVLAWRILGLGEPGGLPSMGLHRVRHDWSDLAAAAAAVSESLNKWCHVLHWNCHQPFQHTCTHTHKYVCACMYVCIYNLHAFIKTWNFRITKDDFTTRVFNQNDL